jgi:hypothetical protein
VKGLVNSRPVNILVNNGAIVNLMSYSLYKGAPDEDLIKTNRTVKGVRGGKPVLAKGLL